MNTIWIEHNGLPIIIDPKEGYEAMRGCNHSLIVMHPDRRQPVLVKIQRDSAGRSIAPANSQLMISGFAHDYYIVYM